jgi:hypothetical protein
MDSSHRSVTLRTGILKVFGSNLCQDTGYPVAGFRGFPQSLQANVGIVPRFVNTFVKFTSHAALYGLDTLSVIK